MTQREIGLAILAAAFGLLWLRSWFIAAVRGARLKRMLRDLE